MSDSIKGHITREYTVWCGKCSFWEQHAVSTNSHMVRLVRTYGWTKTKEHGWVCHNCKRKKKEKA